jgi:hypothetical protein
MRSECYSCKKSFSGSGLIVSINGKEQTYCADCLWKLQKEYAQKKSCESCGYFDEESCEKRGKKLVPMKAGFSSYFVDAESCRDYSTEQKVSSKKKNELSEEQKEATASLKACRKRTKLNLLLPLWRTNENRRKITQIQYLPRCKLVEIINCKTHQTAQSIKT